MSQHTSHTTHANSVEAFTATRDLRDTRREAIYQLLLQHGPMTDRQVMTALGFVDPNASRPRLTDLTQAFWVVECGRVRDAVTGRPVRVSRALREDERRELLRARGAAAEVPVMGEAAEVAV